MASDYFILDHLGIMCHLRTSSPWADACVIFNEDSASQKKHKVWIYCRASGWIVNAWFECYREAMSFATLTVGHVDALEGQFPSSGGFGR